MLAGIVVYFAHWAAKRLENHKAEVQKLSDLERDKVVLKNELEKLKSSHNLQFKEKQLSLFYWPIHMRFKKDTALWKLIERLSTAVTSMPSVVGREIEIGDLIRNHEEIVMVIENHIHLAQADQRMLELITDYVRHVAVYKAIRAAKIQNITPKDLGEPFPQELIEAIEKRMTLLLADFDNLFLPQA